MPIPVDRDTLVSAATGTVIVLVMLAIWYGLALLSGCRGQPNIPLAEGTYTETPPNDCVMWDGHQWIDVSGASCVSPLPPPLRPPVH